MMGVVITGRRKLATLALCSALVLPGCTADRAPAVHLDMEGDLYDRLYPYHAEVCAVTQIRPLDAPVGGSAGHAVMYLKGACKQPDASFPLLETCEGRPGVGISVNKMFRNVNWVAIPERDFFLQGDLGERQRLTQFPKIRTWPPRGQPEFSNAMGRRCDFSCRSEYRESNQVVPDTVAHALPVGSVALVRPALGFSPLLGGTCG